MKKLTIILTFFVFTLNLSAQMNSRTWATLSMVTFDSKYDESVGYEVQIPKVSPVVKMMEGQEIEVEGYIIPLEGKVKQSHFMLSAFPANMCFFCGKAGPETAMQVFMANGDKVSFTDDKISIRGTLRINESDMNSLLYTLENAEIL